VDRVFSVRQRLGDERGAVLTIFAVGIPTIILFLALALDIGNWYVHKRQLQNRVDAAVYAAAVEYGFRFPNCTNAANGQAALITAKAKQFAGDPNDVTAVNTDINANATITVNSTNIEPGTDGTDGGTPCDYHGTSGSGGNPGDFDNPEGYWTDVKAKETNLQSLFGGFGVPVPAITSQARVGLVQPESVSGMRPFAVADPNRLATCPGGGAGAWARFRNEAGSQVGSLIPLTRQGTTSIWTATEGVTMDGNFLRADVVLGSCSNSSQRIAYPNVGFVDDYPDVVDVGPYNVRVLRVELSGNPCNGQYVYRENGACTVSIDQAAAEFTCPPNPPNNNPRERLYVWVDSFASNPNSSRTIELGGSEPDFSGGLPAAISPSASGDGVREVGLSTRCGNEPTLHNLGQHQSIMAGNDSREGPIRNFTLSVTSVDNPGFTEGFTLDLDLLHSDGLSDLRVPIRGAAPTNGNFLSGAVTCGANGPSSVTGATGSIVAGCNGPFAPSSACVSGAACSLTVMPSGSPGSSDLQSAYNNAWCSTNNWGNYPNISRGDPRLILVAVVTPGAAFSQSGGAGNSQEIMRFSGFYVTGWAGASCPSPSPVNDPPPPVIDTSNAGAIWGHFIKFVAPPSSGTPTEQPCNDWTQVSGGNDVALCIAALVR
jgi:hypothetical protein